MGIVYQGGIASLTDEVASAKKAIDKRYRQVLGADRFLRLKNASAELLTLGSYFDSPQAVNDWLGFEHMPEGASNSMLFFTPADVRLESNGKLKEREFPCAIGFYISEHGFQASHSSSFTDKRIASYVHEFDHFVWFALQEVPIYLLKQMMHIALDLPGPFALKSYMAHLTKQDLPQQQLRDRAALAMYAHVLEDAFEKANRILDRQILAAIGVDVPLPWRGEEKRYSLIDLPTGQGIYPSSGDPFLGLDDQQAINSMMCWESNFNTQAPTTFVRNLIEDVRTASIRKITLEELTTLAGSEE